MLSVKTLLSFIRHAFLAMTLLVGLTSPSFGACDKKLRFGWANWAPYHFKNEAGQDIGVSFDVMDKITKAINCEYDAYQFPWKRLTYLMTTGGIDVLAGIQPNAEGAKIAYFSKPYGYQYIALFVRKGESEKYPIKSLNELNRYKFLLGVRDNVDYGPEFKRMLKNPQFKAKLDWLAGPTNPKNLLQKESTAYSWTLLRVNLL
ncbi:substrate-binding periplasmic protein [Alkalimarinus sediminis]|uniref:Transporter substrate-binding domain-containing protein n=1 Tax=Alkalimarinus sediminis TaxID=1632866 RepID=A0A9E8HRY4_9ALTE|nr:transporter substrate-binding domain-containing protein [Alkalimarinus sediminis]UZW74684.1 transporter substrate-binding domain-containing protein [Alkalimarinus sediminis]